MLPQNVCVLNMIDATVAQRTIDELRQDVEGLEAELSVRKGDSGVLMEIVDNVNRWDSTLPAYRSSHLNMRMIHTLIADYVDVGEIPSWGWQTFATKVDGSTTSRPNEDIHIIDGLHQKLNGATTRIAELNAICDKQVESVDRHLQEKLRLRQARFTAGEAVEKLESTIDELRAELSREVGDRITAEEQYAIQTGMTTELRMAGSDMMDTIKGLKQRIKVYEDTANAKKHNAMRMNTIIDDVENTPRSNEECQLKLLLAYADVNRLRKLLTTSDTELKELSELYCDRCVQLEKIEMLAWVHRDNTYSGMKTIIDEIMKIVSENKQ